jgi:hypothetical protein
MAHKRGRIEIDIETLDEIADTIGGTSFMGLHPEHRAKIYDLALKQSMAEDLHEIRRWFEESRTFDGI